MEETIKKVHTLYEELLASDYDLNALEEAAVILAKKQKICKDYDSIVFACLEGIALDGLLLFSFSFPAQMIKQSVTLPLKYEWLLAELSKTPVYEGSSSD